MPATVIIPAALRQFTDNCHELAVEGETVAAVIDSAAADHPQLRPNLLTGDGTLQPFVHVFVNGNDVKSAAGLDTPVPDNAEVLIVQAISGG